MIEFLYETGEEAKKYVDIPENLGDVLIKRLKERDFKGVKTFALLRYARKPNYVWSKMRIDVNEDIKRWLSNHHTIDLGVEEYKKEQPKKASAKSEASVPGDAEEEKSEGDQANEGIRAKELSHTPTGKKDCSSSKLGTTEATKAEMKSLICM